MSATRETIHVEVTPEIERRFMAKVDRTPGVAPTPDCHIWIGGSRGNGYGAIKIHGKVVNAHVMAWIIEKRKPVPKGKLVRHTCECRMCVNPKHLKLGDSVQNAKDAIRSGRSKPFRPARSAPLSSDQINQIVEEFEAGVSQRELSKKFNVPGTSLKRVLRKKGVLE